MLRHRPQHPASADQDRAEQDQPDSEHDRKREERDPRKDGHDDAGAHAQKAAYNNQRAISDLGVTYRYEQLNDTLGDPVGAEKDREQQQRQPSRDRNVVLARDLRLILGGSNEGVGDRLDH